jgi:hypothetical protein
MSFWNPGWAAKNRKWLGDKLGFLGKESDSAVAKRENLNNQGAMSSWYADQAQNGYMQMGNEAGQARDYLRRLGRGEESVAKEQLRQGMEQNMAQQRSMAASASPQNAAMAARTAAMSMGRMNAGMSGQAALAGIQERQAANKMLNDSILQQRQQDAQVSLGARQNATAAYGGTTPEGSFMDKYAPPLTGTLGAIANFSDRLLKKDIAGGDADANKAMQSLSSYKYKYKNPKDGKGERLGIMAQDLEKAGLGQAVIDTPRGKAVDTGALSTANTAMLSALEKRVRNMEQGKRSSLQGQPVRAVRDVLGYDGAAPYQAGMKVGRQRADDDMRERNLELERERAALRGKWQDPSSPVRLQQRFAVERALGPQAAEQYAAALDQGASGHSLRSPVVRSSPLVAYLRRGR